VTYTPGKACHDLGSNGHYPEIFVKLDLFQKGSNDLGQTNGPSVEFRTPIRNPGFYKKSPKLIFIS
jgi:hypothetical protein